MISSAKTAKIFVGVDVSKATLDVYRPDTKELLNRWSCARYYLAEPAKQQFEGLPIVHGLRAEVFDPNVAL